MSAGATGAACSGQGQRRKHIVRAFEGEYPVNTGIAQLPRLINDTRQSTEGGKYFQCNSRL